MPQPESLPNLQTVESESQLLREMRIAVQSSPNKVATLREFGSRILTSNCSADAFIAEGLQVLYESAYRANSESERERAMKDIENWIHLFQLPKHIVERVGKKVANSKIQNFVTNSTSSSDQNTRATTQQNTTALQQPPMSAPAPTTSLSSNQESNKQISTNSPGALAHRPPSDIVLPEKEIIQIDLDQHCNDINLLRQLSYSMQLVFNSLNFPTVQPALDELGNPVVVIHLRVIRFIFRCKLQDFTRFRAMSGEAVQMGMQYLGIPKPTIIAGLRGVFEVQVPKPEEYWEHCPFTSLLNFDQQRRVVMADPSQPPKFPIGVDLQNTRIYVSFEQPILYAGITRSGKSNLARQILLQVCLKYEPQWVSVIAIDLRLKSFSPFQGLPHLWNGEVITTVERAYQVLHLIAKEYSRRDKIFSAEGVDNIWSYNKRRIEKGLPPMPIWFVVLEEIDTLKYRQTKQFSKEIDDLLEEGTRTTSSNGILWAIGAHTPTEESITTDVRDMCPTRVVLHSTPHASMYIFDEKNSDGKIGSQLVGKGDSWVYYFGRPPVRAQIGFLSENLLQRTVEELKTLYSKVKPAVTDQLKEPVPQLPQLPKKPQATNKTTQTNKQPVQQVVPQATQKPNNPVPAQQQAVEQIVRNMANKT
ncbi:DNA segregation ATPase, FtsK/SpoIIIE family [Leptolyngbyaceae cyanobacterium JSC-12]|nr:DNA segregation ATPase, FtsK/SpoIIIE family [Leptolyngbyaceae cyanobacterium JSC-12]